MSNTNMIPLREDDEQPGVEREVEDPQLQIKEPFDPEKIKVRTESRVIEQIISRIRHNEIDLAPDFQRLRGIWNVDRHSRLIKSLLLRIPLPVFYVAADDRDNWAVVDGLQRMSTMSDFAAGLLKLSRPGISYREFQLLGGLRLEQSGERTRGLPSSPF